MTTFPTLREANIARQKEWDWGDKISPAYRVNELAGEAGEACNVLKKLERERLGIRGSRATFDDMAMELADVVICADLVAMSFDVELLLNTGHPVGKLGPDVLGATLAIEVGKLCACVLYGGSIMVAAMDVVRAVRAVAVNCGIDLDAAIARKFNGTSEKVGLTTRMTETTRAACPEDARA